MICVKYIQTHSCLSSSGQGHELILVTWQWLQADGLPYALLSQFLKILILTLNSVCRVFPTLALDVSGFLQISNISMLTVKL